MRCARSSSVPRGVRDRLRWDLETRSIEVVGEFDTIVDARRAGLDTDIIVSTPDPDSGSGSGRIEANGDRVFEEALTHRELEVLELLAEGLPNKGIADRLGISDQTVKFHIASIMGKLGASNRVETVRRAVRRGLLSLLALDACHTSFGTTVTCCRAPLRRIVNPLGTPIRSAVSTRCRSSTPVIGVWPNAMMMSPCGEAGVTRRTARFH